MRRCASRPATDPDQRTTAVVTGGVDHHANRLGAAVGAQDRAGTPRRQTVQHPGRRRRLRLLDRLRDRARSGPDQPDRYGRAIGTWAATDTKSRRVPSARVRPSTTPSPEPVTDRPVDDQTSCSASGRDAELLVDSWPVRQSAGREQDEVVDTGLVQREAERGSLSDGGLLKDGRLL